MQPGISRLFHVSISSQKLFFDDRTLPAWVLLSSFIWMWFASQFANSKHITSHYINNVMALLLLKLFWTPTSFRISPEAVYKYITAFLCTFVTLASVHVVWGWTSPLSSFSTNRWSVWKWWHAFHFQYERNNPVWRLLMKAASIFFLRSISPVLFNQIFTVLSISHECNSAKVGL